MMANLANLKVGDTVSVCIGSPTNTSRRLRIATISQVAKSFVCISSGNKFSTITGKELKSAVCEFPKYHCSLFIDNDNEYWNLREIDEQRRLDIRTLWENLAFQANNKNLKRCIHIINKLNMHINNTDLSSGSGE